MSASAAWSSQDPEGVAACYEPTASLTINNGNGPGGIGKQVRVSGIEVWRIGSSGLVANSVGYYDATCYEHQLVNCIDG